MKTVVLILDADKAGHAAVYGYDTPKQEHVPGLRDLLRRYFVVKVAQLPHGEDPDDVVRRDPTALQQIVRDAAYLKKVNLTGALDPVTVSGPSRVRQGISSYLKSRRNVSDGK